MGKALDTLHERPSALHDKENGGNHHGAPACGKSMTTGYCDSNDMTAGSLLEVKRADCVGYSTLVLTDLAFAAERCVSVTQGRSGVLNHSLLLLQAA